MHCTEERKESGEGEGKARVHAKTFRSLAVLERTLGERRVAAYLLSGEVDAVPHDGLDLRALVDNVQPLLIPALFVVQF